MQITRRAALSGFAAGALAPLAPRVASAAQPLSGQQAPGYYRYKIGEIEVTAVHVGHFFCAPGACGAGNPGGGHQARAR